MTPLEIQFELKKRKIKQKEIAREIGVCEMAVSKTVNRQMISDRIMRTVAEAIDMDRRAVFPEYYFGPKHRSSSKTAQD